MVRLLLCGGTSVSLLAGDKPSIFASKPTARFGGGLFLCLSIPKIILTFAGVNEQWAINSCPYQT